MERENGWYFVQTDFDERWQPAYWNGKEWNGSTMAEWLDTREDNVCRENGLVKVDENRIPEPDEENPMTIRP